MDKNEVIEIIKEYEQEKIDLHKRNGMWIEPVAHYNDHAFRERMRKIRRRSWPYVIAAFVTLIGGYFLDGHKHLANFTNGGQPHTQIERSIDNPDRGRP